MIQVSAEYRESVFLCEKREREVLRIAGEISTLVVVRATFLAKSGELINYSSVASVLHLYRNIVYNTTVTTLNISINLSLTTLAADNNQGN